MKISVKIIINFFKKLQVKKMREEYGKLNRVEMSIWECCELLNDVVDESDPDLDEPQIEHLLSTAEAIRKDYPNEDWLHLTPLIHGIYPIYLGQHSFSDSILRTVTWFLVILFCGSWKGAFAS